MCHCKEGGLMDYAAFHILCLGPWSGRLKVVFSHSQGYEFIYLHRWRGRIISIVNKALCCLDSSWQMPQIHWLNSATGFTLQIISSACSTFCSVLLGCGAFRCSGQIFWWEELGGTISNGPSCDSSPLHLWRQTMHQGWQNSEFENPIQAYLFPAGFPGHNLPPPFLCRWAKLLGAVIPWVLHVRTWSANIQVQALAIPFDLLYHNLIQSGKTQQFPLQSLWGKTRLWAPKKWFTILR